MGFNDDNNSYGSRRHDRGDDRYRGRYVDNPYPSHVASMVKLRLFGATVGNTLPEVTVGNTEAMNLIIIETEVVTGSSASPS